MQTNIKREVSCKALNTVFSYARQNNVDLNLLIEGVPYDFQYLTNFNERIEWWVWCKIISNSRKYFSLQQFEEMGRSFVKRGTYWEGLLWALFLFTSNRFSRILYPQIFKIGNTMFSCVRHHTEFLDVNKFRTTAFLDEGYEFCPEWSFICKGVWDQLAAQIGQKTFKVEMTVTPEKTVFDASWNKESIVFKIKKGLRWFFNIRKALVEITDSRDQLLNQYEKLEVSQRNLQKQTTQLKTAYEISTSTRQSLNLMDTLKAIADALVNVAGFSAVFIQLDKDIDDKDIEIRWQTGAIIKLSRPLCQEIIINEKKIGEYIVNPNTDSDYNENRELIEYLTPVINVAIHDALVLRTVSDYKDNLEQKVADRTIELQKARDELSDTNELLKEAHQVQSRFFTNISHEFRTPLTLILGPAKQLSEQLKDEQAKIKADLIHRSAKNLNHLVDELLDISKIESGEMKLKACPLNLVKIVKESALSFSSLAERRKITVNINSTVHELIAYVDRNKVDKILNNILSNAFKFTPEGGKVEVGIYRDEKFAEISIADTGIGIPQNQIDKIFDRFYQVDSSHTRQHEGTGIGLALTKELIELHKGKIEVESEEGKGSKFKIILRLGKNHLRPEEVCEESLSQILSKGEGFSEEIIFTEVVKTEKHDTDLITETGKPVLLIVEDNPDVRKYVSTILNNQYKIFEAIDGEEGLDKAIECIPDLIISDIMMPKLDGLQMCNKLKRDLRTSHIPVIMLTAKATMQDKINGLELGADEYIMKPFEESELKARIKNLLEQRKRLHEHFRKYGLVAIEERNVTSADQKFLTKVVNIIEENIPDTLFGVEVLAEKIAVSQSLLYKKTNSLTGTSPSELIKKLRLNKAAKLIESDTGNISEIALEVGFNNPSYFAECFHKQFGVAPSQYHRKL